MIEILCTIAGLIAGVILVASLFQPEQSKARFQVDSPGPSQNPEQIKSIAEQLKLISQRVSANVGAHSQKMGELSSQIEDSEDPDGGKIVTAIDEIIEANRAMQSQLDSARARIEMQEELIEKTSQQAKTDALTGLSNRRALDEFIDNLLQTLPENEKVALLLMDIDHFKSFNDSFGHTTGDAVLASFARSLLKCAEAKDYVARYGGEEFAVVMHGESLQELAYRGAMMRSFVSNQVISYEDLQLKITSSGGVCLLMKEDDSSSVYERADEGLYTAKRGGRNCGFYLSEEGWLQFPDVASDEDLDEDSVNIESAEAPDSAKSAPISVEGDGGKESKSEDAPDGGKSQAKDKPEAEGEVQGDEEANSSSEEESEEDSDEDRAEILDLLPFLEKMEPSLKNLRRAELPASAIMVEAIGFAGLKEEEYRTNWDAAIELVQRNLRGIDLVCQFRRQTLCIFITGCSEAAAFDRASQIQCSLMDVVGDWPGTHAPERLAVAVAAVLDDEECSQFLDRLETGLDAAHEATNDQIVVHDGESSHIRDAL